MGVVLVLCVVLSVLLVLLSVIVVSVGWEWPSSCSRAFTPPAATTYEQWNGMERVRRDAVGVLVVNASDRMRGEAREKCS